MKKQLKYAFEQWWDCLTPYLNFEDVTPPKGVEMNRKEIDDSWNDRIRLDPNGEPEDNSLAYTPCQLEVKICDFVRKSWFKLQQYRKEN